MDYYLSPQGNDSTGDGTSAKPWKSTSKALGKTVAGDRVILRQGTYRGRAWSQHSGSPGAYISFESFPGEKATLSALEQLTGWEPYDLSNGKAIYRAPMPFSRCDQNKPSEIAGVDFLTWNGKALREAQWPAPSPDEYPLSCKKWATVDSGQWISDANDSKVTGQIEDADLLAFPSGSLVGSYITILPGARWTLVSGKVTAHEGKKITFIVKSPGGDSFYKPDDRSLYFLFGKQLFLSYPGSWWRDPASEYVYVWLPDSSDPHNALVEALKEENVMDCYQKSYYRFKNISFVGSSGVNTYDGSYFTFEGCEFKYFSHRLYVPNTWFWFNAAIYVNQDGYVIKDCDFKDGMGPAVRAEDQQGLIVENCTAINTMDVDFSGINARFAQNTVWNSLGGCLKLSKNITGAEIKNNDLGHSGLMFTDGGVCLIGTNCIGGGAQFFNNFLHDGYAPGDDAKSYYGTAGIYLESGLSDLVIRHNISCRTTSPSVTMAAQKLQNIHFYNNTFDGVEGIYWTPDSLGSQYPNCKFINNYVQKRGENTEFHPNIEYSRNAFKAVPPSMPAKNLVVPDPKFNPDYSLQVGSPLSKAGVAIAGVTTTGEQPDIGAHEGGWPIVGALLRQKDLSQIKATGVAVGSHATISLSNLPVGRQPGANFSVRIGTGAASSNLNNVPFNSTLGSEILAKVDTGEWVKIGTM